MTPPTPTAAQREAVYRLIPCICDPAYTVRGLIQPDCPRCHYADEIVDLLAAERERALDDAERAAQPYGGTGIPRAIQALRAPPPLAPGVPLP